MSQLNPELNVVEKLHQSALLAEKWGEYKLPNGQTLGDMLTVDGIPLWDIVSAELACNQILIVLAADDPSGSILRSVRPYLSRLKQIVLDLFRNRNNVDGCSTWPHGASFLCLGFTDYIYRDVLQPVATRLVKDHKCKVVSLSDHPWINTIASSHRDHIYQTVWQHWNQSVEEQVAKLHKELRRIKKSLYASGVLSSIIRDDNVCSWNGFQNVFSYLFNAYWPRLIQQAVVAIHILEQHRPTMVLTSDIADPRTRVYTLLCRQMGIPSMGVQFGGIGDEGVEWQFLTTDYVAAWGETSKKDMLRHKVPVERIVITGSPRYDCLVTVTEAEVKAKRAMIGVPEKNTMILLASTYHLKTHDKYSNSEVLRSMKRAIFEAADRFPQICLVVKPHPLEDIRETRVLVEKSQNVIFVERQLDIRELTKVCDAFISFGSTATMDALVADKLSICPVFPGWIWSDFFKNSGATLVPESDEEIMNIFQMVANGSYVNIKATLELARQDFLKGCVYRTDGMATDRVEALALRLAGIGRI